MRWAYCTLALGASPGLSCFLQRQRDADARQRMQGDSGPSFPASPLIQDDVLLRRDFARRGFPGARRVCTDTGPSKTSPRRRRDAEKSAHRNTAGGASTPIFRKGGANWGPRRLSTRVCTAEATVRKRYRGVRWFCQDGRIPIITSYYFVIDSVSQSALQWVAFVCFYEI
jgi:hypothetical protein